MTPRKKSTGPHRSDALEQCRPEVEQRTAIGETCEQIAEALRSRGIDVTNKTISRRRVEWGLRGRAVNKSTGTTLKKARPKKSTARSTKAAAQDAKKAEIQLRTQRGESAEQIVDALRAQGHELKMGASTILRLQTIWGLIPPDENRARSRRKTDGTPRVKKPTEPKVSKREMERVANRDQQNSTMHYPTNCAFGPQKRINRGPLDQTGDDSPMEDDFDSLPVSIAVDSAVPTTQEQDRQNSTDVAADLMSVDFLVDLANSTLSTAQNLKEMLLAHQARRPASNSNTGLPPSLDDLTIARRKVREAAAVMQDLAAEPGA